VERPRSRYEDNIIAYFKEIESNWTGFFCYKYNKM
jgi:hypothetical protein